MLLTCYKSNSVMYLNVLIFCNLHISVFVFSWKLWLRCWVVVLQEPLLSGRGWGGEPGKDMAGGSSFLPEQRRGPGLYRQCTGAVFCSASGQ